jgi:hypothetical protein
MTKYLFKFKTKILKIEHVEHTIRAYQDPNDPHNPIVEKEDLGWFILFEGSHEMIHMGMECPEIKLGQLAIVTIEI